MVMRMSTLLKGMAANPMYSENAMLLEMQVLVEELVRQLVQPRSLVELAVAEVVKEALDPKVRVTRYIKIVLMHKLSQSFIIKFFSYHIWLMVNW